MLDVSYSNANEMTHFQIPSFAIKLQLGYH